MVLIHTTFFNLIMPSFEIKLIVCCIHKTTVIALVCVGGWSSIYMEALLQCLVRMLTPKKFYCFTLMKTFFKFMEFNMFPSLWCTYVPLLNLTLLVWWIFLVNLPSVWMCFYVFIINLLYFVHFIRFWFVT